MDEIDCPEFLHDRMCAKRYCAEKFKKGSQETKKSKKVSKKSKLQQLSPYLDEEGLVIFGGCIKNIAIPDTAKQQITLPGKHRLLQQITKPYHTKSHNRLEHILSEQRQVYWILDSRTAIKKITGVFTAKKMRNKPVTP